jgi:hypothetical protein
MIWTADSKSVRKRVSAPFKECCSAMVMYRSMEWIMCKCNLDRLVREKHVVDDKATQSCLNLFYLKPKEVE